MSLHRRLSALIRRLPGPEDPTADRPYLNDANYYRLGYQLAAQLVNRVEDPENSDDSGTDEAVEIARRFIRTAGCMTSWYEERERAPPWWLWVPRLDPQEERLKRFLSQTVEPCLELLLAAALRKHDSDDARQRADLLRQEAEAGELSYRALYNLACYEADNEDRLESTLAYLRAALSKTPGAHRLELARWARQDPSLTTLHGHPGFDDVLATFE